MLKNCKTVSLNNVQFHLLFQVCFVLLLEQIDLPTDAIKTGEVSSMYGKSLSSKK